MKFSGFKGKKGPSSGENPNMGANMGGGAPMQPQGDPGQTGFIPTGGFGGNAGGAGNGAMGGMPQPQPAPRKVFKGTLDGAPTTVQAAAARDSRKLARITAIAVAVAIAGAGYGIVTGQSAASKAAIIDEQTQQVVVAKSDIATGTQITADMVSVQNVPNSLVVSGSVTSADDVVGRTATSAIPANGVVSTSEVSGDGTDKLSGAIDPGMVAVSVTVDSQTGVAGMLHQGDLVDVVGSESNSGEDSATTLCSGAKVKALDSSMTDYNSEYTAVTVECTPEDAAKIVSAESSGSVSVVLHSSATGLANGNGTSGAIGGSGSAAVGAR